MIDDNVRWRHGVEGSRAEIAKFLRLVRAASARSLPTMHEALTPCMNVGPATLDFEVQAQVGTGSLTICVEHRLFDDVAWESLSVGGSQK